MPFTNERQRKASFSIEMIMPEGKLVHFFSLLSFHLIVCFCVRKNDCIPVRSLFVSFAENTHIVVFCLSKKKKKEKKKREKISFKTSVSLIVFCWITFLIFFCHCSYALSCIYSFRLVVSVAFSLLCFLHPLIYHDSHTALPCVSSCVSWWICFEHALWVVTCQQSYAKTQCFSGADCWS